MRITRYEDLMARYENPIEHACETVSYTHLDVYKRQAYRQLRQIAITKPNKKWVLHFPPPYQQ